MNPPIGDVFYIELENHNFTQPAGTNDGSQQILNNPAAPYLNSLVTPGNPNAAQTSYASDYYNVLYNNPSVSIHPSEPNYIWQEAGLNGPLNDNDPYPSNIVNSPNLSGLLQTAGITWKSYQEDIDLTATSGSVNQPGTNALTSTVAPQSQWTVPLTTFSGTSASYTNPYNGSDQYFYAPKHDGQLFFTDTNGGDDPSSSNPEALHYAPLQQLQTDLTNNTAARYNLITPDLYNDMHSPLSTSFTYNGVTYTANTDQEAVAVGDNFLSILIPKIMASQAYKNNGAIVIRFDESEGGNSTQFTIPEIVISPLAKGNAYDSTLPYTHSSDVKSLEQLFGVTAPGGGYLGDANTTGTNTLWDLFNTPTVTLVGGATNGSAIVYSSTGSSQNTPTATLQPFGSISTDVRTAVGDVNGDGIPDYIFATGPGTEFKITVLSGGSGNPVLVPAFDPFPPPAGVAPFSAGGFVSTGSFLQNGRDQIVVTPDQAGGPRVTIYDLNPATISQNASTGGLAVLDNYFVNINPLFRGGLRTAVGDLNGDGVPDLVVAAGYGGGPVVEVMNGSRATKTTGQPQSDYLVGNFFGFNSSLRDGAYLAVGDVLGNGQQDLILGPGDGGPAELAIYSGSQLVNSGAVAVPGVASTSSYAQPIDTFETTGLGGDGSGLRVAAASSGVGIGDQVNVVVSSGRRMPGLAKLYPGSAFTSSGSTSEPNGQIVTPFGGSTLTDGVFVG